MEKTIKSGTYEHYKGKKYEVIGTAYNSETYEQMVVYRALFVSDEFGKDALWVRPLAMFIETVEVDGITVPRFKKL